MAFKFVVFACLVAFAAAYPGSYGDYYGAEHGVAEEEAGAVDEHQYGQIARISLDGGHGHHEYAAHHEDEHVDYYNRNKTGGSYRTGGRQEVPWTCALEGHWSLV
ncbi:hypothetical protein pipiens_001709 [Culex pipiens pipiens]|uniref:Uncharacterized protein n=1 Tax=Culex pipiens pipiens TaxID=38569 RepID=A0ABD1E2E0_CULPP